MVMKTTPKALKDLFVALGGEPSAVDSLKTVDVLNAIAEKYQGEGDATRTPDAIDAITAVAGNIGGGGEAPFDLTVYNETSVSLMITALDESGVGTLVTVESGQSIHSYYAGGITKKALFQIERSDRMSLDGIRVDLGSENLICFFNPNDASKRVCIPWVGNKAVANDLHIKSI